MAERNVRGVRALAVVSLGLTIGACDVESSTHTGTEQSALTAGIDVSEDWVNHWFAPDTGQRGNNSYGHESTGPTYVYWLGEDPAHPTQYSTRSDCSFFVNATMKRAYGWDDASLKAWLCPNPTVGADDYCGTRPLAKNYFTAVMNTSRFATVPKVDQIQRGDLIALKYSDGSSDSGHTMWADSSARYSITSTDGGGATIYLYDVDVIDSTSSYHGTTDLRYTSGNLTGIGKGTIRIITYADADVAGYTWSTWSGSTKYINYDGQGRLTVVGRYDQSGPGGPPPSALSDVISSSQFDQMFPPATRAAGWTYDSFISAAASNTAFAGFGTTGDTDTRKREVAAFLANVAHETSQLEYMTEDTTSHYCASEPYGCPDTTNWYKGRGPLQLSWNYNYHDAGNFLGIDLLSYPNPTRVANEPAIGWKTSLWFWMTQTAGATMTAHDAMTASPAAGFYETIRVINDIECDKATGSEEDNERLDRVWYFNQFTNGTGFAGILGTTDGSPSASYCNHL